MEFKVLSEGVKREFIFFSGETTFKNSIKKRFKK
jgi:hypothetical protein